jgi:hypothetical protein
VAGIAAHNPEQAATALATHLDLLLAGLVLAPDFDPNYFIGDPHRMVPAARATAAGRTPTRD